MTAISVGKGTGAHSSEPVIVAESPSMRRAVDLARRFAGSGLPILLVGETGTGKEVLAQAIHRWSGRTGELVDIDCGALPSGMVVAELFGHRRGAYTTAVDSMPGLVEQADKGTLFLDELMSLPVEGQAALLRVLETGEVRRVGDRTKHRVNLRLIAAIQQATDLRTERLRVDLYHRLAGTVISIAPLRDRPEDLLPLALHLATAIGRSISSSIRGVLERHDWPGNVRELRHLIVRAGSLSDQLEIDAAAVSEALDISLGDREDLYGQPSRVEQYRMLLAICQRHAGQPDAIADELRISRATLFRRLRDQGISLKGMTIVPAS
jgi:transcriptional regulator with PAS, ATPase and Fis domain